ncbi:MAG: TRAP transporter small permease subunit [Pseudohongiellaceae bacterium]
MDKLSTVIDRMTDRLGRTIAWLALAMVLLMVSIVILRYFFQTGFIAMQEAVMYLNAAVFSLGAGYTLKQRGHVRVDIFYSRLSPRHQSLVDLFGGLVFLLPSMLCIIWLSWDYVALSWRIKETSAEASGLPLVYVLKSGLLALAALLLVQGCSELIKDWRNWRSTAQDGNPDPEIPSRP